MEIYFSAAVLGLLAGAVVGQATARVVNSTLDIAAAGVSRAYENLQGKDIHDPETRRVLIVLEGMDVYSKIRITTALVESMEKLRSGHQQDLADPLWLCIREVKRALFSIEETLKEIGTELDYHRARYLYRWRTSNVDPVLENLQMRLAVLDRRVDMLVKCNTVRIDQHASSITQQPRQQLDCPTAEAVTDDDDGEEKGAHQLS